MTDNHPNQVTTEPPDQVTPHTTVQSCKPESYSAASDESKYRRLIEGISGDYVIYTHAPDGTVTYISPSVKDVLGFLPEDIIGRNWRDLVGENFIGREQGERVEKEVEEGTTFHKFMAEFPHVDGTTRLGEIQQKPLFDEEGNYVSMEGIARDLTESIQNAQELNRLKENLELRVEERTKELSIKNKLLLESELRYRSIVEDQQEFVTRWLPGGELTFANDACCRFLEKPVEEVIGKSFYPMVYEEDLPKIKQQIASLTPEQPHATIEHRVYRSNGSISWMHWTNRALFDENGEVREYQSVGKDITELKLAAETIREKEIHLAHVSRLATMGELVAGIAHEVHQPLHAAKTFAEAARRSLTANLPGGVETAIECTREISEAISRTAKIIRRLRDFTTPNRVEFEKINLSEVVVEASRLVSHEATRANVQLQFDLYEEPIWIQADRVQIEQACVNLLMNGFEAMMKTPADHRVFHLSTEIEGDNARITFRDSGCGVKEENMSRLFDAFFTTKTEGMGMGLSLCRSIAVTHRGDVRAEHNEDSGMTFILTLPRMKFFRKSFDEHSDS